MKQRAWILAAALVVSLGGVTWLAIGLSGGERRSETVSALNSAPQAPGRSAPELAAAPENGLQPAQVQSSPTRVEAPVGGEIAERIDPELRAAHWVEGRVELAEGTPLDEDAWVLARGRAFENRPLYRGKVQPDGKFRVAFAQGTQVGWLAIDAHYNYLLEDLAVRPRAPAPDIVLRGTLGGCVRGRILLPATAGEYAAGVRAGDVSASDTEFDFLGLHRRPGHVHDDLTYEVGGLEARSGTHVTLRARGLAPCSKSDVTIEAGRVTLQDLAPEVGVRLTGRVTYPGGGAAAGARVRAGQPGHDMSDFLREFQQSVVTTKEDGTFDLLGLEAGDNAVVVELAGWQPLVHPLGTLALGARVDGLELVLDEGLAITGRVEFPDGKPAASALVDVEAGQLVGDQQALYERYAPKWKLDREPVETSSDGSFRLSGLYPGSYAVVAQAWRSERNDPAPSEGDDDRARKVRRKGSPWSARAEGVGSGTRDVVVTLRGGETIRGRVVDSSGKPVERFVVSAQPDPRSEGYTSEIKEIERAFRDPNGRFALDGLRACKWSIDVRSKTCLDGEGTRITVPGSNQNLEIVLLRHPDLRGVVQDPDGHPLAGAKVVCRHESERWWQGTTEARTSAKGEFRLREAPVGPVRLFAEASGFARSEPLLLDLTAGAQRTGIVIKTCKPARIHGTVIDDRGEPGAGRSVSVSDVDTPFEKSAKSDAEGHFEFDGLGPGRYAVQASAETDESDSDLPPEVVRFGGLSGVPANPARRTVVVRAGETVEVTLGERAGPTIRMHGRVTARTGHPTTVVVRSLGTEGAGPPHKTEIGPDGHYELTLPRGGPHRVEVGTEDANRRAQWLVEVPAVAEFEKDFEFPSGHVAGRVVDARSAPVAGQRVVAWPKDSHNDLDGRRERESNSDDAGHFRIDLLEPGTYTVEVVGPQQWWDESADHGRARVEGVVVTADKSPDDVELVLATGGGVRGTVRSATGEPLPWAELFAFDDTGHALSSPMPRQSGSSGRFLIEGLPSGRVLLYARNARSAGKAVVEVEEERTAEADIVMRPAADLTVLVRNAAGATTLAPLEIVDAEGRRFEEISPLSRFVEAPAGARAFPSLPAGRYALRAALPDGTLREKSAQLAEGGHVDVELR